MANTETSGDNIALAQAALKGMRQAIEEEAWPVAQERAQDAERYLDAVRIQLAIAGMEEPKLARVSIDKWETFPKEVLEDLGTSQRYLHEASLESADGSTASRLNAWGKVEVALDVVEQVRPWLEKRIALEAVELPPMRF